MSVYGLFQPSVLGMESQSHALQAIAANISNVRTGGYKRTDVEFATVLSQTFSSQPGAGDAPAGTSHADLGGAVPHDRARISLQGSIEATDRELDVALNGRGYFVLNTAADGSGEELYGRDGRFEVLPPDGDGLSLNGGYVIDKNGYYVQGWEAAADGTLATPSENVQALWIDPNRIIEGQATTSAALALNLPAETEGGEFHTHFIDVYDNTGNQRSLALHFTRSATPNTWDVDVAGDVGDIVTVLPQVPRASVSTGANETSVFDPLAGSIQIQQTGSGTPVAGAFTGLVAGDPFTVTGSGANDGSYVIGSISPDVSTLFLDPGTPLAGAETVASTVTFDAGALGTEPLLFRPDGYVDGPAAYTLSVAYADGAASAFTLDVTAMTQFGGPLLPITYEHDGFPPGELEALEFDTRGRLSGRFDNGQIQVLYQLALADFANADGLAPLSGNVYALSGFSGDPQYGAPGEGKFAGAIPSAHEISNVDIAQEFTRMIMTQSAYNASATSFRTLDEMTATARDLKA